MKLDEEIRRDNRIVAGWLLDYPQRKQAYEHRRQEILYSSSASAMSKAPARAGISDTTGRKVALLAELETTERWLKLVEEVERRLPWKMQIVLRLRRESRYVQGRWKAYAREQYTAEVAAATKKRESDVWVGEESMGQFWRRVLEYTARAAGKKGLL